MHALNERQIFDLAPETSHGGGEMKRKPAFRDAEMFEEAVSVKASQLIYLPWINARIAVLFSKVIIDFQAFTKGIGDGSIEIKYEAAFQWKDLFMKLIPVNTEKGSGKCLLPWRR